MNPDLEAPSNLEDNQGRRRFTEEIDQNFSVQASAGAGKTTLLIARVRHLARHNPEALQRLVLVTYTNRAADEIRQRLRTQLLDDYPRGIPPMILQGMSRMFIGTIHGFCLQIIQDFALFSGYPAEIEVFSQIRSEWIEKWESELLTTSSTTHRWISEIDLYELGWEASEKNRIENTLHSQPHQNPSKPLQLLPDALDHVTGRSAETIAFFQKAWRQFTNDLTAKRPAEIPEYNGKGGKALQEAWRETTTPLLKKMHEETIREIEATASRIRQKRFQEGTLLFSDQIALAYTLLHRPSIRTALQNREYRILLDEAQDTDPFQFSILLELTRPPGSPPFQWSSENSPPRPGHFSMVGDLKQSIYRDRADLQIYQEIHHKLSQLPAGEPLTLSQTFRCRPQIVSWVNHQFSSAFESRPEQVPYSPLNSGDPDEHGQVALWTPPPLAKKASSKTLFQHEAEWIIQELRSQNLELLRASRWSEVALLAPTRKMLIALQTACESQGILYKTHFDTPHHERVEYRWIISLLSLQEKPDDTFNLLGVLREIFAFSDTRLASLLRTLPQPLTLFTEKTGDSPLDDLLLQMRELYHESRTIPLPRLIQRWIDRFQIEDRLLAIAENPSSTREGLHTLILQFAQNDPRPRSEQIQQWIDDLSRTAPEPSPENPDSIQLMTIKKSKGLQWDCVILPFLGALSGEGGSNQSHPSVEWYSPPFENPVITFNRGNKSPHAEEEKEKQKKKLNLERQRLYYVACTRSRHTLILVDDANHWTKILTSGEPKLASPNAYEALHPDPASSYPKEAFQATTSLTTSTLTPREKNTSSKAPSSLPNFDTWTFTTPSKKINFPQRQKITPSTLKKSFLPEKSKSSHSPNGRLYGTLWHRFMEFFPWKSSFTIQNERLSQTIQKTVSIADQDRLQNEWSLLTQSHLYKLLIDPEIKVLTEIPYTSIETTTFEEGEIDLILQHSKSEKIEIIDWKTDQLTAEEFERKALPGYTLQIQSYQRILQKTISLPITATIYHTPTGKEFSIK